MDSTGTIVYLNPRDILPSRHNVRSDPGDLAGLAETIREHGILQPLGVARENGDHRVVYGNRRRAAAIVVGLDRVPCMLVAAQDDQEVALQQILENMQRLELSDMDKSRAFAAFGQALAKKGLNSGEANEMMARTLGLSTRQIQRYLRLGQLAAPVQQLIAIGDLGVTHGQHLVDVQPPSRQEDVALLAVEESLSAAELSRLSAALVHNTNIDPESALAMLRRGERVAQVEARPREVLSRVTATPIPQEGGRESWDEQVSDDADEDAPWQAAENRLRAQREDDGYAALEPTTRDGNRVRRIHSLDAFMDELQRLTICVQEGDLQRLVGESEGARVKTRLAARQLTFLSEAVSAIADSLEA